jgi:GT2 family glycosyltransferase
MAYYNRRSLLINTLQSIAKSKHKDFEVILVDDASVLSERVEDLVGEFPFLKIIRLERTDKWYTNCCIPYNIGIAQAKGNIVMIQNPECLHTLDILSYVNENINDQLFLSMGAYACSKVSTEVLKAKKADPYFFMKSLPQITFNGSQGWYNHSKYRPVFYHFCCALTKKNLDVLGGFDERFAKGIAYDDDEFVTRVQRMGLTRVIVDEFPVIHQYHSKAEHLAVENYREKHERNKKLFQEVVLKENLITVNNSYHGCSFVL